MTGREGVDGKKYTIADNGLKDLNNIWKKRRYRHWTANQRRNTERNRKGGKRKKIQQDFLWALGPEAAHQTAQSEHQIKPDKIKIDKLIKLQNRYYLPKRTNTTLEEIFLGKTNRYANTGRPLGEIDPTGKRMRFCRF